MTPLRNSSPPRPAASLTCFGVGDGWPCADRNHSAYLYRLGGRQILIDCGDGTSSAFKRLGGDYAGLDRVILSHLHSDHIGGFPMFVQGLWLERRRRPMQVNLPAEGIRPLRTLLKAAYLFDELIGFPLEFTALRDRHPVEIGRVRVTPFHTCHLENLRRSFRKVHRKPFECFSFLLEAPGLRVAHTADIGHVDDLAPLLAKPVDHLLCELAHCGLEETCEALRQREIGHVTFNHLSRELWAAIPETRRRLKARLGGIPFTIAREDLVIPL